MSQLPANISVANARLPETYENAKAALASCASIDECVDWANKSEALASYARQSEDDTLEKTAVRIRARAIRRCGELLKTFDGRPDNRKDQKEGNRLLVPTREEAASGAGMSSHQAKQAVRVANVPSDDFDAAVESEKPPTISQLAQAGIKPRALPESRPAYFAEATKVIGALKRFAELIDGLPPAEVAQAIMPHEVAIARKNVAALDAFIDAFVVNLKD